MQVEIWSDVVCPWCYIGKRRFESALDRFAHADDVEVTWRSFELDPGTREVPDGTMAARMGRKYGLSPEVAAEKLVDMDRTAEAEGLAFHLADTVGGNSFAAHRVLHLARESGRADELKEALLHASFITAEAIGDPAVVRAAAVSVGLDPAEVDDVLAGDRYAEEVRAEEAQAVELGATGVPFFVFDRTWAVPGAQDADVFLQVLERAWARSNPDEVVTAD
jgi:predicted DsbA family dithiol-disulfide isomerase